MWIPRGTVDLSRATATPLVRFLLDPPVSNGLELRGRSQGPVEPSVPNWGQGCEGSRHRDIVRMMLKRWRL